jgi:hypothetical protein
MKMNPALDISPDCGALAVDKALTVVAGQPEWRVALDQRSGGHWGSELGTGQLA